MTNRGAEASPRVLARVAGVLYLLIISLGLFSEMWVRGRLVVPGDATTTAGNIMASEWLFRVGFASDAIVFLSDVVLAVLFYILLKSVSKTVALIAASFRLAQKKPSGAELAQSLRRPADSVASGSTPSGTTISTMRFTQS